MIKRPLCIATGCYVIGIIMGLYLQISIVFLLCFTIFITIFVYFMFHKIRYAIFIIFLLSGFICIKVTDNVYVEMYQLLQDEEEYTVQGIIVSDVLEKEYKNVYEIELQKVNDNSKYVGKRWLLEVKKSKNFLTNAIQELKFGDCIVFQGKVEIPSSARNYMGFDYQQYLKSKKLYGTIVAKDDIEVVQQNQSGKLEKIWHDIRKSMKEKIYMLLPENARELCLGILIGERGGISEEMKDYFKKSNLTHMLAVSGAHISYVILALTKLFQKMRYRFRKILMIFFLCFFIGLTGFTPSVQRAGFMAILLLIAELLHRKVDVYTSLSFSSLVILLNNPYAVLNIGFQLSYGGTIGIILFQKKISKWMNDRIFFKNNNDADKGIFKNKKNIEKIETVKEKTVKMTRKVIDIIAVTISANLVILPIMAFQFNTISFTFWISNLLAGPFLGIITIWGFVLYFCSFLSTVLASIIAVPLKYLLYLLILLAKFCSQIPCSSVTIRTPFLFEIVIYYVTILLIDYFPNIKKEIKQVIYKIKQKTLKSREKIAGENKSNKLKNKLQKFICVILLIFIVLCISVGIINKSYSLRIYFVDVGQGDCTLICTPTNKTILIDGGGSETGSFDVGEKTLLPYLLDRKITKIDYVMVSHFDADHVGGLIYILEHIEVKNVIIGKQGKGCESYERFKELLTEKNISVMLVKQGDKVVIDRFTYFDILFPSDELVTENVLNNNSIVSKLSCKNFSCVFTGDIEELAEKKLIENYKDTNLLKADVLKVAHHGSKTSSTQDFLQLICPKIALIGVGENNKFGHPNAGVIERLEKLNTKVYRTDKSGEIQIKVNNKGVIKIKTML